VCTFNEVRPLALIILVADDNALSLELIRELLEGSGQVARKVRIPADLFGIAPHSLTYTLSALQLVE
jgi:CheY-like chemotaxis protein